MAKVSLIIPSRNEPLLKRMVDDVFLKATGEIEVIVVLDGPTNFPLPRKRRNLIFIRKLHPEGLRPAINDAAKIATGKYIMKSDSHVAFSPGFDKVMQKDISDNWISVPRRYDLDINLWEPKLETQVDYYYLGFPYNRVEFILADMPWPTRMKEKSHIQIDDLMTFGGTVWFTSLSHFNNLGGMESKGYGTFAVEQQELGLKTWLVGGRVIINKNAWYAHYGESHTLRPYRRDVHDNIKGCIYSARYWTENRWPNRIHNFEWLIDKFWPLPSRGHRTGRERHSWPPNWRDYLWNPEYSYKKSGLTELCHLAIKYGNDRHPLSNKHSYTPFYYHLFEGRRKTVKKVLEIGVGEGAGLMMWRDFFPNAFIYGADNQDNRIFEADRIKVFKCDQSSRRELLALVKSTGGDLDIVIDDASHKTDDQINTCLTLMPLLKRDVTYIVEDVAELDVVEKSLLNYEYSIPELLPMKRKYDNHLIVVKNIG